MYFKTCSVVTFLGQYQQKKTRHDEKTHNEKTRRYVINAVDCIMSTVTCLNIIIEIKNMVRLSKKKAYKLSGANTLKISPNLFFLKFYCDYDLNVRLWPKFLCILESVTLLYMDLCSGG
jgi:hypothetical protein